MYIVFAFCLCSTSWNVFPCTTEVLKHAFNQLLPRVLATFCVIDMYISKVTVGIHRFMICYGHLMFYAATESADASVISELIT